MTVASPDTAGYAAGPYLDRGLCQAIRGAEGGPLVRRTYRGDNLVRPPTADPGRCPHPRQVTHRTCQSTLREQCCPEKALLDAAKRRLLLTQLSGALVGPGGKRSCGRSSISWHQRRSLSTLCSPCRNGRSPASGQAMAAARAVSRPPQNCSFQAPRLSDIL